MEEDLQLEGIFAGGFTASSPTNIWQDTIDFVTTPTLGDAQDFGNLNSGKSWTAKLVQIN